MLEIPNKPLTLAICGILGVPIAGTSTTTYADTLARHVMVANGDKIAVGSNRLVYTIGQPFISTDYSSRLTAGFLTKRKMEPSGNVVLGIETENIIAPSCSAFSVTIFVKAETDQTINAVSAYLDFDANVLEVIDIISENNLEMLESDFDNGAGHIDFSGFALDNEPSGIFKLMTIKFGKVLNVADSTHLAFSTEFPRESEVVSDEGSVFLKSEDISIAIQEGGFLAGQVTFQGHVPEPDSSWVQQLQVSANKQPFPPVLTDKTGSFRLEEMLVFDTYYIQAKHEHTVPTQQSVSLASCEDFEKPVDFETPLWEGDSDNNAHLDYMDFNHWKLNWKCATKGTGCEKRQVADRQVDFNVDGLVDMLDLNLWKENYRHRDENKRYDRRGEDSNQKSAKNLRRQLRDSRSAQLALRLAGDTTLPPVGEPFNIVIELRADEIQDFSAIATHLKFDPALLRINRMTASHHFDTVLESDFDNERGLIDFLAVHLGDDEPNGTIELVTINLTLLGEAGEKTLAFNSRGARQSEVGSEEGLTLDLDTSEVTGDDTSNEPKPASCQLYGVHDGKLNNTQFFTVTLNDHQVSELGPMYKGHDIEALAIHPETNMMYAASGDNVSADNLKGHFYQVDGQTGQLIVIGSTGFDEIEALAFSADGTLWAWAKGDGLITIDPTTGTGTLVVASDVLMEGLTLNKDNGTIFYGAVNTELWIYDMDANTLEIACTNLLGETEALEMMSGGLLLIGAHKDKTLSVHVFDPKVCQVIVEADIPTNKYNDVEGIALPIAACTVK